MRHFACMFIMLVMACGSGEKGPAGETGPAGPAGPQGEKGEAGGEGTNNSFSYILSCNGLIEAPLNTFWDGLAITYQRAETVAGDVYVTGYTGGKGDINESATTFYKKGMTGADKGALTIGVGNGAYLTLDSEIANSLFYVGKSAVNGDVGGVIKGCTRG